MRYNTSVLSRTTGWCCLDIIHCNKNGQQFTLLYKNKDLNQDRAITYGLLNSF